MPAVSYPGVYFEELPSGVHMIVGVSTSNAGFIDYFNKGPVDEPVLVTNLNQFYSTFGGLTADSQASYGILQYFQNGGQLAYVQRRAPGAAAATLSLKGGYPLHTVLNVSAANPGKWGNDVYVRVETPTVVLTQSGAIVRSANAVGQVTTAVFNLIVSVPIGGQIVDQERWVNLTMDRTSPTYVESVVNSSSQLIRVSEPAVNVGTPPEQTVATELAGGTDGIRPGGEDSYSKWPEEIRLGLDVFKTVPVNILCLPVTTVLTAEQEAATILHGMQFAKEKNAFYIIDAPSDEKTVDGILEWKDGKLAGAVGSDYSALYFPRISIADPSNAYRPLQTAPSGSIAAVYARTDTNFGVWKAPAGVEGSLSGATIVKPLTDNENGRLNVNGIDALRNFPIYGNVVWGARTLDGTDQMSSDFKYVPVRRLTSYIEESLMEGTLWAVFQPNNAILWSSLRLSVDNFMAYLAGRNAFYNYYVQCDSTTTTPSDIEKGIVNVLVAFAPVKPAEFIVLQIQQLAGQATS